MALMTRISTSHSVREFRRAARLRFAEANRAVEAGDRLIGIYLAGYAAEMTLKAAYFQIRGKGVDDSIGFHELHKIKPHATTTLGLAWQRENLHHLIKWGEILIAERRSQGNAYASGFEAELIGQLARLYGNWRESLRYHGNRPRPSEVAVVFQAVRWLLTQESRLTR